MQQPIIEESRETSKKKRTSNAIPIRAFFMACARNWYWFVLSTIAFGCLAFLYSKSQPLLYNSKALVLLTSKDSNMGTQSQAFSDLGITTGNSFMPNEIYKIRSTDLMENVVKSLGSNIQYYGHVFLRDVNIYRNSPVQITPLRNVEQPFSMTIVPKGANDLEFKVDGDGGWKKTHFGNKVNTAFGPIAITKNKNYDERYVGYKVIVRVNTTRSMARNIVNHLTAEQADKLSDVLRLNITWDNKDEAVDILNTLIASYNQDAINDKNAVARNTEKFIAERVEGLSQDLSGVDSQVAQLRTAAASSSIYADPGAALRYADNSADVDMQAALASSIFDYISKMGDGELIPSNTGIANTGIESQIQQYNESMLKYQKIAATSSNENPVMVELTRSLATQRQNILHGLTNYVSSMRMKQSQARAQQSHATGSIVAIPSQ